MKLLRIFLAGLAFGLGAEVPSIVSGSDSSRTSHQEETNVAKQPGTKVCQTRMDHRLKDPLMLRQTSRRIPADGEEESLTRSSVRGNVPTTETDSGSETTLEPLSAPLGGGFSGSKCLVDASDTNLKDFAMSLIPAPFSRSSRTASAKDEFILEGRPNFTPALSHVHALTQSSQESAFFRSSLDRRKSQRSIYRLNPRINLLLDRNN